MGPAKSHKEYRQNQVSTSSQGKLILMMYEGAIKFANMALISLDQNDISKKCLYLRKTQDIINELSLALNLKKGGEVAHRLESLYQFMLRELTQANIHSERKTIESVLKVLIPLKEAWDQLMNPDNGNGNGNSHKPNGKNVKFTSRC